MRKGLFLTLLCSVAFSASSTPAMEGQKGTPKPERKEHTGQLGENFIAWGKNEFKFTPGEGGKEQLYGNIKDLEFTSPTLKEMNERIHIITKNPNTPGAKAELEKIEEELLKRQQLEAALTKVVKDMRAHIAQGKK